MDEKIRINKYLSEAGICSRREADRMIEEGRITVNGKKAESGQKVSLEKNLFQETTELGTMIEDIHTILTTDDDSLDELAYMHKLK